MAVMIHKEYPMPEALSVLDFRRNPYDLHWRKQPSLWEGNIDGAYKHKYGHVGHDDPLCYHCGAIPCPLPHDEEKKMRLIDLEFVKELARERRELKLSLEEMRRKMLALEEETSGWRLDKILLEQQIRDLEKAKGAWLSERNLMDAEISRLKGVSSRQVEQLSEWRRDQAKLLALEKKYKGLEKENGIMKEENAKFKKIMINQSNEVLRLSKENESVSGKLDETQKTVRILHVELSEARELSDSAAEQLEKKDEEVSAIRREMGKLTQRLADQAAEFERRERESADTIKQLRTQIRALTEQLQDSESENAALKDLLRACHEEIELLKAKLQHDRKFRQFVDIKREVLDLRERNESLKHKVVQADEKLKDTATRMSAKGRARSAAPGGRRRAQTAGPTRLLSARSRICNLLDSDEHSTAIHDIQVSLNDQTDL